MPDTAKWGGGCLRLGVIGPGAAVHRLHRPALDKLTRQVSVVAVAGRSRQRSEELARPYGARVYDDYRRLLDDPEVDAVLIAVPIEWNARILAAAIRSGKHVLAEKPLAATLAEGQSVLDACSGSRSIIAVAENFRYRKDLARALQILASGEIGEVFAFQLTVLFDLDAEIRRVWTSTEWRQRPAHPGGFLLDAGVHPVSFLRDLLGEVAEVSAQVLDRHPVIQGPDSLLMQLKLASGAVGQYFACYTATVREESMLSVSVYGSQGTLSVAPGRVTSSRGAGGPLRSFRVPRSDRGYLRQWQNFLAAVQGKEQLVSTAAKAFGDLAVIEAALASARERRIVAVEESRAARTPDQRPS
ncbi:MAG: Gfo/Idh/MocA family oxidoreductase [Acidobacteria bacterium]|nr:Gfo/Idh/MocA family oxidoreductase [Acidobacteriota bacterium]